MVRVAIDEGGRVVGFVTWFPYDDGGGFVLDLMRRTPEAPNPTVDLLVADGLQELATHGVRRAGLGSVPRSPGPWAERWYPTASLKFYKDKFDPKWSELFVVMPSKGHRLGAGWALFRAAAPQRTMRDIIDEMMSSVPRHR